MSEERSDETGRERVLRRVRYVAPLVALGVLAVVGVLTRQTADTRLPLDPDSTGPSGTKALTLILEEIGAEVEVLDDAPVEAYDTILVLVDNLSEEGSERLLSQVRDGGVLVVTDPGGGLTPSLRPSGMVSSGPGGDALSPDCDLEAVRDAQDIDVGFESGMDAPVGSTGCYRAGELSWLVAQTRGAGTSVAVGGTSWLTNRGIRAADNAVLAAALLAPQPGTRVGILRPDFAIAGSTARPRERLTDLIPTPLKVAFVQLLVAFAILAAWRARRLGAPQIEHQPVRLPGSELVVAVGNLLQRTDARPRAAALLRADLRAVVSRRLGTPAAIEPEHLAEAVAVHAGVDAQDALRALNGPDPVDDAALIELAQETERIRSAVVVPFRAGDSRVHNQ